MVAGQSKVVEVKIRVAWGDMDAYRHVNNTVFLRWFETARIRWFDVVQFPEEEGKTGPVVRIAKVEFVLPVKFPDTIAVKVWPTKMGRSSVTLVYETWSTKQKALVASGESLVVFVDFEAGASRELPRDARSRIEAQM
jgi:acyl-CoA thioester hydrolase